MPKCTVKLSWSTQSSNNGKITLEKKNTPRTPQFVLTGLSSWSQDKIQKVHFQASYTNKISTALGNL